MASDVKHQARDGALPGIFPLKCRSTGRCDGLAAVMHSVCSGSSVGSSVCSGSSVGSSVCSGSSVGSSVCSRSSGHGAFQKADPRSTKCPWARRRPKTQPGDSAAMAHPGAGDGKRPQTDQSNQSRSGLWHHRTGRLENRWRIRGAIPGRAIRWVAGRLIVRWRQGRTLRGTFRPGLPVKGRSARGRCHHKGNTAEPCA